MKNSFLTLLICFTSLNSFSTEELKHTPRPTPFEKMNCETKSEIVQSTYKTGSGNYLSCDYIKDFENTLKRVLKISPVAPKINLLINKEYPNASFDTGLIIRVPLRLTFIGNWGQTFYGEFMASHTVLAHEYGHAIFSKMLENEDFFVEMKEMSKRASTLEIEIQKAYLQENSQELIESYYQDLKNLNEERINNKAHTKIRNLLTPYDELFADLIAALALHDKRAMVNALYYDEASDQAFELILARDFDVNQLNMHGSYLYEEHGMLAPTRRFIGQNIWPTTELQKSELINILYESIVQNVKEAIEVDHFELDALEINEKLIKTLKEAYTLKRI